MRVHVAHHLLQLVGREYLSEDIEHLARALGVEIVFDLLDALEQFFQDPALTGVCGDEIEDEAIEFLAIAVNPAHALLKADRIPRDVVIDH